MDARTGVDEQVLTVRAGARRIGLRASEVAEVVRAPRLTRVPNAPAALTGVASVRGQVVPVVSLRRLLGDDAGASERARVVLLDRQPALGLEVDEVAAPARGATAAADGALVDLEPLLERAFGAVAPARRRERAVAAAAPAAPAEAETALLAFDLADQAYAMGLEHVREVMAVPEALARLPRTDAAMVGVFDRGGELLPAVSARALLGLPPAPAGAPARILVVGLGGAQVGLLVDAVRSVRRAPPRLIGAVPPVLNRAAGEARITAMLRTEDGRLIAVLSPERLFADASLEQILETGRETAAMTRAPDAAVAHESFVVFRLGEERYGLPIAAVREVVNLPEALTRLPKAPPFVAGVMSLRGEAVPVIDQRRRFGVASGGEPARRRVLVADVGELRAGFVVDEVSEVLRIPADRLQATPGLAGEAGAVFDRIADLEVDGRMVLLVDPRQLLDRAERDLVAAMTAASGPGA